MKPILFRSQCVKHLPWVLSVPTTISVISESAPGGDINKFLLIMYIPGNHTWYFSLLLHPAGGATR